MIEAFAHGSTLPLLAAPLCIEITRTKHVSPTELGKQGVPSANTDFQQDTELQGGFI